MAELDFNYWQLNTPVVFMVFNRLDTTQRVFSAIAEAKPPRLYLIADGPRADVPSDSENCTDVRNLLEHIDWDCQVFRNYAETNMGTHRRVSSGLSWVFEQEEEAIILEDDCLPDPSFFRYCEELLKRYRENERITVIAGTNFQFGRPRSPYSYYFSIYNHMWGWATWQRAWQHYDENMTPWPELRDQGWLRTMLPDEDAVRYWQRKFQLTYNGKIDTWDYRWIFSCWLQHGLSIFPTVNLVSNIGFTGSGTHTLGRHNRFANVPTQALEFPLVHPPEIRPDTEADRVTQHTQYRDHLLAPLKTRVKKYLIQKKWIR